MKSTKSSREDHEELDAQFWIIKYIATKLDPTELAKVRGFWRDSKYIILFGNSMKDGYAYYGDSQVDAVEAMLRGLNSDKKVEDKKEELAGEKKEEGGEKES